MNSKITSETRASIILKPPVQVTARKDLMQARQRLGLRRPSAAFNPATVQKAPEDWRSPKPGGSSNGSGDALPIKNAKTRTFHLCGRIVSCALLVTWLTAALPAVAQTTTTNAVDFAAFQVISQRNIFDQSRLPHERAARPTRVADSFSLVGTLFYAGGDIAFFDGTSDEYRKALKVGGDIAGFKVTAVTLDSVTLSDGTNQTVLKITTQMRRDDAGHWSVFTERASYASAESAAGSNPEGFSGRSRRYNSNRSNSAMTTGTVARNEGIDNSSPPEMENNPSAAPASGGANDALARLMQRRAQEEQQLGQGQ
jgi:hypothetical protein